MVDSAEEFYSKNVEKQWKQYKDENLVDEFLEYRRRFVELVGTGEVLDAGCGPGRDVNYFVESGLEALGIDISESMVEFARSKNKGKFEPASMDNMDFGNKRFDGIWCSASIFFLKPERMKETIREFYRMLDSAGILYIDFKQGDGHHVKKKWGSKVDEWHVSSEEGQKMIQEAGFEIIEKTVNESNTGNKFIDFYCRKPKET